MNECRTLKDVRELLIAKGFEARLLPEALADFKQGRLTRNGWGVFKWKHSNGHPVACNVFFEGDENLYLVGFPENPYTIRRVAFLTGAPYDTIRKAINADQKRPARLKRHADAARCKCGSTVWRLGESSLEIFKGLARKKSASS